MKILILFIVLSFFSCYCLDAKDLISSGDTIIVLGDKVNVRNEPSIKSKSVYQLRIAERVKLIKRSKLKFQSDGVTGEWIYIDTEYTKPGEFESIKGWVVDCFLADYSKFEKIKYSLDCSIKGTIGDWQMNYEFIDKGKYRRLDKDFDSKKESYKIGTIYQFRKVIIFKDDNGNTNDYFYFTDDNQLCHYYRDRDGNSICTKCKVKK
jgi:hypothetical protein